MKYQKRQQAFKTITAVVHQWENVPYTRETNKTKARTNSTSWCNFYYIWTWRGSCNSTKCCFWAVISISRQPDTLGTSCCLLLTWIWTDIYTGTASSALIGDIREGGVHPRGEVRCVQRKDRALLCLALSDNVVKHCCWCINQHKCLYSVPVTEQYKRPWLCFIFNDNVPATVRVSLYVVC